MALLVEYFLVYFKSSFWLTYKTLILNCCLYKNQLRFENSIHSLLLHLISMVTHPVIGYQNISHPPRLFRFDSTNAVSVTSYKNLKEIYCRILFTWLWYYFQSRWFLASVSLYRILQLIKEKANACSPGLFFTFKGVKSLSNSSSISGFYLMLQLVQGDIIYGWYQFSEFWKQDQALWSFITLISNRRSVFYFNLVNNYLFRESAILLLCYFCI